MHNNIPKDIRTGCPWYKPTNKQVDITPDYFVHESKDWLVFPHELSGLTPDEISTGKSDSTNIKDLFI